MRNLAILDLNNQHWLRSLCPLRSGMSSPFGTACPPPPLPPTTLYRPRHRNTVPVATYQKTHSSMERALTDRNLQPLLQLPNSFLTTSPSSQNSFMLPPDPSCKCVCVITGLVLKLHKAKLNVKCFMARIMRHPSWLRTLIYFPSLIIKSTSFHF